MKALNCFSLQPPKESENYLVENHLDNRSCRDAIHRVSQMDKEDAMNRISTNYPETELSYLGSIRYANGTCSKETSKKATPLILSNEKGTFRLEFDCRNCQMNVISISQNVD